MHFVRSAKFHNHLKDQSAVIHCDRRKSLFIVHYAKSYIARRRMAEKTPVSVLQELCIQEGKTVPMYDLVQEESDGKKFTYIAHAFDMYAKGSGRSKREAKHEASAKLICLLKEHGKFNDKQVPQTPRPTSEIDAVGTLLDICVQRNLPIASFEVLQASGQPHAPSFTVVCRLASIQRSGEFSTKKGAKQLAAQAMLNVVQQLPSHNDEQKQIATLDFEPPEKVMRTYRELKKNDIKPEAIDLSQRHDFFKRLPEAERTAAIKILRGEDDVNVGNSQLDLLDLICKAMKVPYELTDVPNHPCHHKMFIFKGDFDSVHIGSEYELFDRVIDYLMTMFNLKCTNG